jgi:hypothetical protein
MGASMTSFFNYFRAAAVRHPNPAPGAPPWMQRPDWASRVVVDRTSFRTAAFLSAFCLVWCAACVFIFVFIFSRDGSAAGGGTTWGDIFVAVIFPLSAVAAIAYTVAAVRAWRRYGNPALYIDTLPAYLGDRFRGSVTLRLPDRAGLEAIIACERRTYRWVPKMKGGRKKEWTTEALWSAAHPLDGERIMLTDLGASVPVDVPLPADQPATIADAEEAGIRWCLYLRTAHEREGTAGAAGTVEPESELPPSYAAQFVIPVFARG